MSTEVDQQRPEAVARAYFEALAAHDVSAMAALWHPDGVEDVAGVGILRGPREVEEFFSGLIAALPDVEWTVERITADDRMAAVQWRASGTFSGGGAARNRADGQPARLARLRLPRGRGWQDHPHTAYQDSLTLMRGIGVLPAAGLGAREGHVRRVQRRHEGPPGAPRALRLKASRGFE